MGEYRAYTVGRDGHFIEFKALACANDAEADRDCEAPCQRSRYLLS
jgi:hypothetical protein